MRRRLSARRFSSLSASSQASACLGVHGHRDRSSSLQTAPGGGGPSPVRSWAPRRRRAEHARGWPSRPCACCSAGERLARAGAYRLARARGPRRRELRAPGSAAHRGRSARRSTAARRRGEIPKHDYRSGPGDHAPARSPAVAPTGRMGPTQPEPAAASLPASCSVASPGKPRRVTLRAVLFDVDFTLAKPGPDLGPEGYLRLGAALRARPRPGAVRRGPPPQRSTPSSAIRSSATTRSSGSPSPSGSSAAWAATPMRPRECAVEMTRAWEHSENFDLYDDVLPVLGRAARARPQARARLERRPRDLATSSPITRLEVDARSRHVRTGGSSRTSRSSSPRST